MNTKLKRRLGISTVITTMIILVASVVLGTGVVLYGTSIFQTGTLQEGITTAGTKIWAHPSAAEGLAWGATAIRNTGDKIISVDNIQVRGLNIPFAQWYVDSTVSVGNLQADFKHPGWSGAAGGLTVDDPDTNCASEAVRVDFDGAGGELAICGAVQSGPSSLAPGSSMLVYFQISNGTITQLDSGATTSLGIFAGGTGAPESVIVQNP